MTRPTPIDLRRAAEVETQRLTKARTMLRDADDRALRRLEADGAWIALARRPALRRALGTRLCLLWRAAFEDASGRLLETRIVAVLVEVDRRRDLHTPRNRRAWIRTVVRDTDEYVRGWIDADCSAWREEVERIANSFWRARLARERAIAANVRSIAVGTQPGLFDRRAERSRVAHISAVAESERASAERVMALTAAAELVPRRAQLLLAIVP